VCADEPAVLLEMKRQDVREAVGRFRAANPRAFGSVLPGTDRDGSDPKLRTPGELPQKRRVKVFAEAPTVLTVRLWRAGTEKP
jgi:hypothetical protein